MLREPPWYQEILREGEQRGLHRGRSLIVKQLTRRVGGFFQDFRPKCRQLSIEQREALGEALLDFTQASNLAPGLDQSP